MPVDRLICGLVVYEPWMHVHRTDPVVARGPHLFRGVADNQLVGPEPPKSANNNSL